MRVLTSVRLRVTLPDELYGDSGALGEALGRTDGLSLQFMDSHADVHKQVHTAYRRRNPGKQPGAIPSMRLSPAPSGTIRLARVSQDDGVHVPPAPVSFSNHAGPVMMTPGVMVVVPVMVGQQIMLMPQQQGAPVHVPVAAHEAHGHAHNGASDGGGDGGSHHDAPNSEAMEAFKRERMAGTALVLAFLSVNNTVPVAELTSRKEAAVKFFHGVRVPGIHHDFENLMRLCMGFLIEGNLTQRKRWLEKARMWRMVLLQRPDGSWSLTQSLAAAVEAHAPCEAVKVHSPLSKLTTRPVFKRIMATFAMLGDGADAEVSAAVGEVFSEDEDGDLGHDDEDVLSKTAKELRSDDPLQFSAAAMRDHLPAVLAALGRQGVHTTRVWATLLAMVALEECEIGWLISEDEDPVERTVVDAADAYLRAQAEEHPALDELLRSGELHRAARRARKQWTRLMEAKVSAVRKAEVTKALRSVEYVERASARFVLSMMTEHDQFSTFLDESAEIMRWQRWMILMTLVCSALLVSIWFYQSRSAQCCAEIRAILNCESPVSCLGFTGSCSDLPEQFSTLQGPFVYGTPPSEHADLSDYVCHAFPDDDYPLDQVLVGLINIAIAIPTGMFLFRCFELANEGEDWPDAWLEMPRGWLKVLFQLAFGHHFTGRWHYFPPLEGEHRHAQEPAAEAAPATRERRVSESTELEPIASHNLSAQKQKHHHVAPPCRSDLVRWYVRHSYEVPTLWVVRFVYWSYGLLTGTGDAQEGESEAESDNASRKSGSAASGEEEEEDEAAQDALMKRLYAGAGLLGIYMSWAIYSWFIFTYGSALHACRAQ